MPLTEQERQDWNAAVESGDATRIATMQHRLIRDLTARVMDEDDNYRRAGWRPGRTT